MSQPETQPPRTVSQVLAAHAAAQIAAAQNSDLTQRSHTQAEVKLAKPHCASFTVTWASVAMCIGFKKPAAEG